MSFRLKTILGVAAIEAVLLALLVWSGLRFIEGLYKNASERKSMTVHVKYFASLRDRLGRAGDRLDAVGEATVAGVWAALWPETPLPPNTLVAVNMEYAGPEQVVRDGDEVAFFPPVTGG